MIWSLIVGGIVGWLASILMKADMQMGLIANILVGIVGSALRTGGGGWCMRNISSLNGVPASPCRRPSSMSLRIRPNE